MPNRNASDTAKAGISAAAMDHQTPSTPNRLGRISTASIWKTSVRRKDTAAEIAPLFSAVKKDEMKMLKPEMSKVSYISR